MDAPAKPMSVSPLLLRFVDDELARAPELVSQVFADMLDRLSEPGDAELAVGDRQQLQELADMLRAHGPVYQAAFIDALRSLAIAEIAEIDPAAAAPALAPLPEPARAEVLDELRVDSDIEISRAIALIDEVAAPEQQELQAFTTTLQPTAPSRAESNPLRPQTYARALWYAGATVRSLRGMQPSLLLRVSATALAERLKASWSCAGVRMADQGVPRHADRTDGPDAEHPAFDVSQPGALEGLLTAMPSGPSMPAPVGPPPGTVQSDPPAPRGRRDLAPSLDAMLRAFEARLQQAGGVHEALPRLSQHESSLLAVTTDATDRPIIELVARLFDAMLLDARVPPAFRGVLARFQGTVLRLALHDPFTLETHRHPVWTLLDRIATAGPSLPAAAAAERDELLAFCHTLADEVAADPAQDTALCWRALGRLDALVAAQLARRQRALQPVLDGLQQAERIDQMREQISARLIEQMVRVQTRPAIRRFVTGAWAEVLALAMQRFGEKSETAITYLQTVDDLIWTLQVPDHPQSRQRLMLLLPGLLQRLRDGMALIEMPDADQQAVFDELVEVHTAALRESPRTPGVPPQPPLSPQEVVQKLREESGPMPLPEQSTLKEALIDLVSLDTVPAEWLHSAVVPSADDPPDRLHDMAPGARYRIFLQGRWRQVQLLWRSTHGQFLLFTGEVPGETHPITQRALGKLSAARLLMPADDAPPLLQRAVDAVLRGRPEVV